MLYKWVILPNKFTAVDSVRFNSLTFFVFPGKKICSAFSVSEVHNTHSVVGGVVNSASKFRTPLLVLSKFTVHLIAFEGTIF